MALAIDGHANGSWSSGDSGTVTLSTTDTHDVIILCVETYTSPGSPSTVSMVQDGAGLQWNKRTAKVATANNIELWWAYSAGALSSDIITVTMSGTPSGSALVAFGISGSPDPTLPFDTNASFPASIADSDTVTVSSTDTAPFVIALYGREAGSNTGNYSANWSGIDNHAAGISIDTAYQLFAEQLSSSAVTPFTNNTATTQGMVVDALTSHTLPAGLIAQTLNIIKQLIRGEQPTSPKAGSVAAWVVGP